MNQIPPAQLREARAAALDLPWTDDDTALLLAAFVEPAVLDVPAAKAA